MDSMKAICDDVIFETSLEQGNDDLLADLFAKTGGKEFYFKMGVMKGVTAFPRKFGLVSDGPVGSRERDFGPLWGFSACPTSWGWSLLLPR